MCQLAAIERYCKVPISGIREVTLYVPSQVAVLPSAGRGVYSADEPVLTEGASSVLIPFDRFSCSLQSTPDTGNVAGDFWSHQVKGNLRRNRADIGLWMLQMRNREFHLIAEDWYGERMLFLNMRLQASRTVEERLSGRNGFTFTFFRRSAHPGIYLTRNATPPIDPEVWGDPDADTIWGDADMWGFEP